VKDEHLLEYLLVLASDSKYLRLDISSEVTRACNYLLKWLSNYPPVPHTFDTVNGNGLDMDSNSVIANNGLYGPPTRILQRNHGNKLIQNGIV